MDVGPETIKESRTSYPEGETRIVWNGPLGYYEEGFDKGTIALLKVIAESKATSVIGGGDTAVIVEKAWNRKQDFICFYGRWGNARLSCEVEHFRESRRLLIVRRGNPVRDSLVMYYTYLIGNEKGKWYTGYTRDLRKRLRGTIMVSRHGQNIEDLGS
jgi:hypothetical protein